MKGSLKPNLELLIHINYSAHQKIYNGQENRVGRYQQENLQTIRNVSSIRDRNICTTNTTSNIAVTTFKLYSVFQSILFISEFYMYCCFGRLVTVILVVAKVVITAVITNVTVLILTTVYGAVSLLAPRVSNMQGIFCP